MTFTLALVGRPNVGKSTLFNRLTGRRRALVDDEAGTTRDRRQGKANLGPLEFNVIDTAGLETAKSGSLEARMTAQTEIAIAEADAVLMLIDAKAGITPADRHFANAIRKSGKPVVLAVNKAEAKNTAGAVAEAHALGLGTPIPISAEHGEGLADLHAALAPFEKGIRDSGLGIREEKNNGDANPQSLIPNPALAIAIIGRPNAGKSTLFNRIVGEDRMLTGPEAGITRDAVMVEHVFDGETLALVDTAGMRRKSNIKGKVEKLAVADALMALQYASVAVLVMDAEQPLEKQDNDIAALTEQEGRALVIAVNKWDTVEDEKAFLKAFRQRLEYVLPQVKGVAIVPVSAKTGFGVSKLLKECLKAHGLWNREFSTGELNRWLEAALEEHAPPLVNSRRIKIRYMTQKSARPPTFILFANTGDIPESYLRYLVNSLREHFRLPGVPIRFKMRKGKNPYAARD